MEQKTAVELAELFSTLSDASRVRIISALTSDELNVGEIAERVDLTHSAVSHHLRHLRQMRLVRSRKAGRYVYYSLDDDHVEVLFRCGLEHIQHG